MVEHQVVSFECTTATHATSCRTPTLASPTSAAGWANNSPSPQNFVLYGLPRLVQVLLHELRRSLAMGFSICLFGLSFSPHTLVGTVWVRIQTNFVGGKSPFLLLLTQDSLFLCHWLVSRHNAPWVPGIRQRLAPIAAGWGGVGGFGRAVTHPPSQSKQRSGSCPNISRNKVSSRRIV
jgi:hypothetical protein